MTCYIALVRAVNVGGTGMLRMADLRAMCGEIGFRDVRTYLASGNAVFRSEVPAEKVSAKLAHRLTDHLGRQAHVMVRTAAEMQAVLDANPFSDSDPRRTVAIFLDRPPAAIALEAVNGGRDEALHLGIRVIYVHYPSGMGSSKLRIPAARAGTARNMKTVARLAKLAADP